MSKYVHIGFRTECMHFLIFSTVNIKKFYNIARSLFENQQEQFSVALYNI